MKVYTAKFVGFYPVGSAAVVVADNEKHATALLEHELMLQGLPQVIRPSDMELLVTGSARVRVLCDGNY